MDSEGGEERQGLTYAGTGVDIDASEAATAALVGAAGEDPSTEYAGLIDLGGTYLGLATDGVGTKLLVAEAMNDYSTIGIDCIAMNVNDLVAAGVEPVGFVDYLAVAEPDERVAEQVGTGLDAGATESDVALVGGETAVMPEVVHGLDLAGTAAGVANEGELFPGEATVGDALVGFPSSGIHSNGLTLARTAVTRDHDYTDPFPGDGDGTDSANGSEKRTIGEALLEPTRIYTYLLDALRTHDTHAAAHITGGGWTNLDRMGEFRYEITEPFDPQPIFAFVQSEGGVSDREMYATFNMGTGFIVALDDENATALADATDGKVVGRVRSGSAVSVADPELRFE